MIDEKKLLEKLNLELDNAKAKYHESEEDWFYGAVCSALETTIKLVEKQPIINSWIPCSERLPEINQTVLVTTNCNNITDVTMVKFLGNEWEEPDYGDWGLELNEVIAWQPLPEPYKKEE